MDGAVRAPGAAKRPTRTAAGSCARDGRADLAVAPGYGRRGHNRRLRNARARTSRGGDRPHRGRRRGLPAPGHGRGTRDPASSPAVGCGRRLAQRGQRVLRGPGNAAGTRPPGSLPPAREPRRRRSRPPRGVVGTAGRGLRGLPWQTGSHHGRHAARPSGGRSSARRPRRAALHGARRADTPPRPPDRSAGGTRLHTLTNRRGSGTVHGQRWPDRPLLVWRRRSGAR